MNLEQLKASNYQMLEIIGGSKLYGLDIATSDTDIRGIFNLPIKDYIRPDAPKQIACNMNDEVHYEVARFLSLAQTANPNMLELLFAPDSMILKKSKSAEILLKHKKAFLTKACRNSLGGYAIGQIKKARGLNKKIVNPCIVRKSPLDFCYLLNRNEESIPLSSALASCHIEQDVLGVTKINNFQECFVLYSKDLAKRRAFSAEDVEEIEKWIPRGLIGESSNDLRMSSIPKKVAVYGKFGIIHYNKDGYISHCKEFKEYQSWVEDRNPDRYKTNADHGKGYDSKNMMHCFRLLNMGIELAETGEFNVVRNDREFLLNIRSGSLSYEKLIEEAEEKIVRMDTAFNKSDLPDSVSSELVNSIVEELKF